MLKPTTTEEAQALLGKTCRTLRGYNGRPYYKGRLVLWTPSGQQWLIYSSEMDRDGIGHNGGVTEDSIGGPTGNHHGHRWCHCSRVSLAKQYIIRGNELLMEDEQ